MYSHFAQLLWLLSLSPKIERPCSTLLVHIVLPSPLSPLALCCHDPFSAFACHAQPHARRTHFARNSIYFSFHSESFCYEAGLRETTIQSNRCEWMSLKFFPLSAEGEGEGDAVMAIHGGGQVQAVKLTFF